MVDLNRLYQQQEGGASSAPDLNQLYNLQQSGGVDLNAAYNKQQGNIPIDLNIIERIESNGNNEATSKAGAKGIMQFEPATAREYSKRLFGNEVSDASTLSLQQQKEMAQAYFNDLLKEFHGNTDEAIAAYNWGQGNVEKALDKAKKQGGNWLDYLPQETQDYVNKYHDIYNTGSFDPAKYTTYKEDISNAAKSNLHRVEAASDWVLQSANEIPELWGGKPFSEKAESFLSHSRAGNTAAADSEEPVTVPGMVVGDALESVELLYGGAEEEGATLVSKLPNLFDQSVRGQLLDNGDVTPLHTIEDLGIGSVFHGVGRVASGKLSQAANALDKLIAAKDVNPALESTTRAYLANSRLQELGEHLQSLRSQNPKATLFDAMEQMKKEVPDMAKGKQYEDLKALTKKIKINVNAEELISKAKTAKNIYYGQISDLAHSEADRKYIQAIADANDQYRASWLRRLRPMAISNDAIESTLMQKAGNQAGEWLGLTDIPFANPIDKAAASSALKPEVDELIKSINADQRRIGRELKDLEGKHGISYDKKRMALERSKRVNAKKKEYLQAGMKGNYRKVSETAKAIKEIQDQDFAQGRKHTRITQRFSDVQSKFKAMQIHKLEGDQSLAKDIARKTGKKAIVHGSAMVFGTPVTSSALAIIGSLANGLSNASKSSALAEANKLAKLVESGAISEDEAKTIIKLRIEAIIAMYEKQGLQAGSYFQK